MNDSDIIEIANETHRAMPAGSDEQDEILAVVHACMEKPIDMVLHCPACGLQHVDAPGDQYRHWSVGERSLTPFGVGTISRISQPSGVGYRECFFDDLELPKGRVCVRDTELRWPNEPHRSHLCHGCGHIWRPADVPTNGVQAVKTKGKADSPIATAPSPTLLTDEQIDEAIEAGLGSWYWANRAQDQDRLRAAGRSVERAVITTTRKLK